MKTSIEISLYPLEVAYEQPILDFIHRLNQYPNLQVVTNTMSTQIFGDYDELMEALTKEIKVSFQQEGARIFVMKLINLELLPENSG